ncbi:MAG TPA: hypothetical protein VF175_04670, partial [Lacipirellula sp.]
TPEYMLDEIVRPFQLQGEGEPKKHLYLRRTWRLTEPPEQAWLQLIGHDGVEVWVNGRRAGRLPLVGYGRTTGGVFDITPLMHGGVNSVAVHVSQLVLDRPPAVAVSGECRFADGNVMRLDDPEDWKAAGVYERRGPFWYETAFEDSHWAEPSLGEPVRWRAQVDLPPRSVSHPRESKWITPPGASDGAAAVARTFTIDGPPRDGWLRVLTTGSHRVAVNGYLLTAEQPNLGIRQPKVAREETFDISPLLQPGENTVSILAETPGEPPRVIADLEAISLAGERTYVATDSQWRGAVGLSAGWLTPDFESGDWERCNVETGYLGVVPRTMARELVEIKPGGAFWAARGAIYAAWIAGTAVVGALGASLVGWTLARLQPVGTRLPDALPFAALLPSAVAAAAGGLMTWDLAWGWQDVYQPMWLAALWALVAAQWLLLVAVSGGRAAVAAVSTPQTRRGGFEWAAMAAFWMALGGLAIWLRLRDITAEPIHHDEVTAYAFTETVFQHGFPGGQVHPDIPFGYAATNELCYYFNALAALFFDDPLLVIRVPAMIFSMLTLALVAYVGWKWFDGFVGAVAGVLFAVSPHMIGFANFGRYLAQTEFFTLLTMYGTYEAVRGTGKPKIGMMWAATLSFIAMYFSWEGAGMFGLGLALAVFFHRRRHLKPLLASPHLYMASTVLLLAVFAQNAHRIMQQTQRLWYGEGISSLTIKPMWRYPFFQHDYYLINSSWTRDALLPMIALVIACILAIRHRWRLPLRFSLICLIVNAEVMAAFLPVRTNRYSCHLIPIMLLITAAVAVAGAEALVNYLRANTLPRAYRWYARGVAIAATAVGVALASGWTVRTAELTKYANASFDIKQLRVPDWGEPTRYLHEHLQEGDVVISIFPHTTNYLFAAHRIDKDGRPRTVDYWLESRLILQATMGDSTDVPRDRRSGAEMIFNLDQVRKLFAENERIWYLTMPGAQGKLNDGVVSQYLREHMDVVAEDFTTALMVRDKNHRPAPIRLEEEEAGHIASEYYLR